VADDMGEKTEDPTPKRLEDARSNGNIPRSQELSSAVMLLAATLLVAVTLMPGLARFRGIIAAVLTDDMLGSPIVGGDSQELLNYVATTVGGMLLPMLLIFAAISFLSTFSQIGWLFSLKPLQPKLSTLNPINGFKKIFAMSNLVKAGLSILKLVVVISLVVLTIYQYRHDILVLAYLAPMAALSKAGLMLLDLALRLVAVLLLIGLIDFFFQRWKHKQDLKMTKQEVKDEMKQSDGDPHVKRRRARMAQEIAMQRINAAVPRADVIVTNPEHVSIAIKYDAEKMNAPTVVAKGQDFLALRIRQIALMHEIPIVERPPLARSLYRQVGVGQEVPPDFYHAVAEILAYVYQLKNPRAAG
jgi:flagellar biosynthetic protein FlhB